MRISHILALLLPLLAGSANAGITLYFRGQALDDKAVVKILEVACLEARRNGWQCDPVEGQAVARQDGITAKALRGLEKSEDLSAATGVVVRMHDMSEPLYLVFSRINLTLRKIKSQRSDVEGPVKRADGRILDLVSK